MDTTIVDFEKPPVAEVVCGLGFERVPQFHSPHMGLFWAQIRDEFPISEVHPPIQSSLVSRSFVEFVEFPELVRHFYRSADRSELVQLQQDRFLYNWLKASTDTIYPRYKGVITRFGRLRKKFDQFFKQLDFPPLRINELRLEYVNHVLKGEGWESPADINDVFPDFRFRKKGTKYLRPPTAWNLAFRHPVKDPNSQMNIAIRTATKPGDGDQQQQIFLIQLSVIGRLENPPARDIQEWFDMAREAIDLSFVDLTAPEMQKRFWKAR